MASLLSDGSVSGILPDTKRDEIANISIRREREREKRNLFCVGKVKLFLILLGVLLSIISGLSILTALNYRINIKRLETEVKALKQGKTVDENGNIPDDDKATMEYYKEQHYSQYTDFNKKMELYKREIEPAQKEVYKQEAIAAYTRMNATMVAIDNLALKIDSEADKLNNEVKVLVDDLNYTPVETEDVDVVTPPTPTVVNNTPATVNKFISHLDNPILDSDMKYKNARVQYVLNQKKYFS